MRHVNNRIGTLLAATPARAGGALALLATLGFGGCAQQPQQLVASAHSKEYFPASVYGPASRRVVENGPVPHGGGQYLVGRPYTIAGQTYVPSERKLVQVGNASWYGDAFHGRLTANGEIYDRDSFTAAHPTMPLPSYARVTNLRNNASMIVRVNDRGPFAANRVMDVSRRVAESLDFKRYGTAKVKVEYVGRASLAGSDDAKLYATLRTNGPAQWNEGEPTMVAAARPAARVASIEPIVAAPAPAMDASPSQGALPSQDALPRPAALPRREIVSRAEVALEPARPPRHPPFVRVEPVSVERPVHLAAREETHPMLHWQKGPGAREIAALPTSRPMPARHEAEAPPRPAARPAPRAAEAPLPPTRHGIDLGTIPGAGVPIGAAHRGPPNLRLARARDD